MFSNVGVDLNYSATHSGKTIAMMGRRLDVKVSTEAGGGNVVDSYMYITRNYE